jgi:hypothetical protein
MHTHTVISHLAIWTSLCPLTYYNVLHKTKICKLGTAGTTMDKTLTIPDTLEIIRKPGNATRKSVIMAPHNTGVFNIYGINKHKEKITYKNLRQ